jgi:hypothetical protein
LNSKDRQIQKGGRSTDVILIKRKSAPRHRDSHIVTLIRNPRVRSYCHSSQEMASKCRNNHSHICQVKVKLSL